MWNYVTLRLNGLTDTFEPLRVLRSCKLVPLLDNIAGQVVTANLGTVF